jgi:hypothetical protein
MRALSGIYALAAMTTIIKFLPTAAFALELDHLSRVTSWAGQPPAEGRQAAGWKETRPS